MLVIVFVLFLSCYVEELIKDEFVKDYILRYL